MALLLGIIGITAVIILAYLVIILGNCESSSQP